MFKKSPLAEAYSALSPTLFKNQPVFYNIIFGFDMFQEFIPHLICDLRNLYTDSIPFDLETKKKFYSLATDCCNPSEFKHYVDSAEFKNAFEHKPTPIFSGEFIGKNRGTKNKTINGTGDRHIPKFWIEKYDKNDVTKSLYYNYIAWVLQYYYIVLKDTGNNLNVQTNTPEKTINDNYTEYFSLNKEDQAKISRSTGISINSFRDIAKYIHGAIQNQCSYNLKIGLYANYSETNDNHFSTKPAKRNLEHERQFYHTYVDCYGNKSIDRFHTLKRYASTNTFCACELGAIYYYGETFFNDPNTYVINADKDIAAEYFKMCVCDDIINPSGCWSLGYMILDGSHMANVENRIELATELFERCGKYGPAKNSLAKIEREKGDICYKECIETENKLKKRKTEKLLSLLDAQKKEAVNHYVKAINLALEATNYGWLYSYNLIYHILSSPAINMLHEDLISHPEYIEIDRLAMLQKAADMKNSWAMDKLACEIMQQESVSEEDRKKAHSLLIEAAKMNYSRALEHLSTLF